MQSPTPNTSTTTTTHYAKPAFYTVCALTSGLAILTIPFLRRYTGAPYVPSTHTAEGVISRSWQALRLRDPPARMIDLGCGNGRLLIAAARDGLSATGVELNPWLVMLARRNAYMQALGHKVSVLWKDLWTVQVDQADVVVVYGVPGMMEKVGRKLREECHSDCIVCTNMFPIPGWTADNVEKGVWVYKVGMQRENSKRKKNGLVEVLE